MSVIERFATSSVAPLERLEYWNRLANETFTGLFVDSPDEIFAAEMWRWTLGELTMIRPHSQAAVVQRWSDGPGHPVDRIILHLQHRGYCRNTQWARAADLHAGDFALCASRDPYRVDLSSDNDMLVVEMPRAAIEARLPGLDGHISRLVSGTTPGARLLHDFLLSLWQQGDQSQADPQWQQGVANVFLDLLAVAVKGAGMLVPPPAATRDRVLALIEANLCDPELRTGMIADELGISMRTVQNVFAAMGTTPSFYILQRRLARAADRLAADRRQSITAIAFDLGFNDSAYFARCFRQQFGVTPSVWRGQG